MLNSPETSERAQVEEEVSRLNQELTLRAQETALKFAQGAQRREQRLETLGEREFELVANSIPQLAWIANPEGWIYWYNQRWYQYTGTYPGELSGWDWTRVHDPNILPTVLERWKKSIASAEPFSMEFPLRGADGRFRKFMTRVLPIRTMNDSVACWVGTNTDIEDQRTTEEQLKRLYDSGVMGVFYWSFDGTISNANDKFLDVVGFSRQELDNGEVNWLDITPPEYASQDQRMLEELKSRGISQPVEKEIVTKSGNRVYVEQRAATTRETGGSDGVAFILDITHRKGVEASLAELTRTLEHRVAARTSELADANHRLAISEAQLRAVLGGATEVAIIATDLEGVITVFNSGAERMLQYSAEEIIGLHTPSLFHLRSECEDRANDLSKELGRRVSGFNIFSEPVLMRTSEEREWCYVRRDSTTLSVCVSTTAIRDADNAITGFLGIATDITARKALERDLRDHNLLLENGVKQRTSELERALLERTVLLQEVHHRVKNNLAVVISLLGIQADVLGQGKASDALADSQRRVYAMALIHEHLYGTRDLKCITFDDYAGELANELYIAYASPQHISIKINAATIELPVDTAIPCGLILNELVTNALKYAFPDARPGEIRVEFEQRVPGRLTLAVSDNGVGLPECFDSAGCESLGLKLVHILVRQLAGTIRVVSALGARFEIEFPVGLSNPCLK